MMEFNKRIKRGGPVAQLAELPAHNRLVPGSSPGRPTTSEEEAN